MDRAESHTQTVLVWASLGGEGVGVGSRGPWPLCLGMQGVCKSSLKGPGMSGRVRGVEDLPSQPERRVSVYLDTESANEPPLLQGTRISRETESTLVKRSRYFSF